MRANEIAVEPEWRAIEVVERYPHDPNLHLDLERLVRIVDYPAIIFSCGSPGDIRG